MALAELEALSEAADIEDIGFGHRVVESEGICHAIGPVIGAYDRTEQLEMCERDETGMVLGKRTGLREPRSCARDVEQDAVLGGIDRYEPGRERKPQPGRCSAPDWHRGILR